MNGLQTKQKKSTETRQLFDSFSPSRRIQQLLHRFSMAEEWILNRNILEPYSYLHSVECSVEATLELLLTWSGTKVLAITWKKEQIFLYINMILKTHSLIDNCTWELIEFDSSGQMIFCIVKYWQRKSSGNKKPKERYNVFWIAWVGSFRLSFLK